MWWCVLNFCAELSMKFGTGACCIAGGGGVARELDGAAAAFAAAFRCGCAVDSAPLSLPDVTDVPADGFCCCVCARGGGGIHEAQEFCDDDGEEVEVLLLLLVKTAGPGGTRYMGGMTPQAMRRTAGLLREPFGGACSVEPRGASR